jgi:uncharacterized protein
MIKLTSEMKEVAEKGRPFVIATASPSGEPNAVSITFAKIISDDEIILVDNFMKKTIQNIKANPRVSVLVWAKMDTGKSVGYQFKGEAGYERAGELFNSAVEWTKSTAPQLNPKGVVVVKIDSIYITTAGPTAGNKVE